MSQSRGVNGYVCRLRVGESFVECIQGLMPFSVAEHQKNCSRDSWVGQERFSGKILLEEIVEAGDKVQFLVVGVSEPHTPVGKAVVVDV